MIDGHNPDADRGRASPRSGKTGRPLAIVARTQKGWGVESLLKDKSQPRQAAAEPSRSRRPMAEPRQGRRGLQGVSGNGPTPPARAAGQARTARAPARIEIGRRSPTPMKARPWPTARRQEQALHPPGLRRRAASPLGHADERIVAARRRREQLDLRRHVRQGVPATASSSARSPSRTWSRRRRASRPAGYIPFASTFAKFLARGVRPDRDGQHHPGQHQDRRLARRRLARRRRPQPDEPARRGRTSARSRPCGRRPRQARLRWLFHPADAVAAYHLTADGADRRGMCYMRTHRPDVALLYDPATKFELGGFNVLQTGDDLALVASGYMVFAAPSRRRRCWRSRTSARR